MRLVIFSFFILILSPLKAETLVLDENSPNQTNLKSYFYHFEDKSNTTSIDEVLNEDWEKLNRVPAFMDNKSIHWLKFSVENNTNKDIEKSLFIPYNLIHKIDVFQLNRGQVNHLHSTGSKRSVETKQNSHFGYNLSITIPAKNEVTYFLKFNYIYRPLRATTFLLSPNMSKNIEIRMERTVWLWRGVFTFATILAFILFMLIKNRVFLFYVILNLGLGCFVGAHIGDINFFIDKDINDWSTQIDYLGAFLINLALPRFLNSLSPIAKRNPIYWNVVQAIVIIMGTSMLFTFFTPIRASVFTYYTHFILMFGGSIIMISLPIMLIPCIKNKDKNAIPLFAIYSFFIFSTFLNIILPNTGLVEDSPFVFDSFFMASFIEIFTFMFLMGRETFSIYKDRANLLERQKGHQREMLVSMVESQEKERNRVGRELHDLIGANMAIIKQRLPEKEGELYSVINDTIEDVRNLSHGLITPMVKEGDFIYEIKEMCHLFSTDKMKVNCIIQGWPVIKDEQITHHLYRICQELLHNASKHSNATKVFLQLFGEKGDKLTVFYEDNGIGFDPNNLNKGVGIQNIKNRVDLINARLEIESSTQAGTSIILSL